MSELCHIRSQHPRSAHGRTSVQCPCHYVSGPFSHRNHGIGMACYSNPPTTKYDSWLSLRALSSKICKRGELCGLSITSLPSFSSLSKIFIARLPARTCRKLHFSSRFLDCLFPTTRIVFFSVKTVLDTVDSGKRRTWFIELAPRIRTSANLAPFPPFPHSYFPAWRSASKAQNAPSGQLSYPTMSKPFCPHILTYCKYTYYPEAINHFS